MSYSTIFERRSGSCSTGMKLLETQRGRLNKSCDHVFFLPHKRSAVTDNDHCFFGSPCGRISEMQSTGLGTGVYININFELL